MIIKRNSPDDEGEDDYIHICEENEGSRGNPRRKQSDETQIPNYF